MSSHRFFGEAGRKTFENDASRMRVWASLPTLYACRSLKRCLFALLEQDMSLRSKLGGWRISQVTERVRAYSKERAQIDWLLFPMSEIPLVQVLASRQASIVPPYNYSNIVVRHKISQRGPRYCTETRRILLSETRSSERDIYVGQRAK